MKALFLFVSALTMASYVVAVPPKAGPTAAACKADLNEWSQQKTETLTIEQISQRMDVMVASADEAHHHWHSDKRTTGYLDEFYRVHTELANRTFDFITRHNLKAQFDEEENRDASGQTASKEN